MIKIKDGEVRPEGCICELNFGYNAKTVVYTNSSSDIPKLCEMPEPASKTKIIKYKNAIIYDKNKKGKVNHGH